MWSILTKFLGNWKVLVAGGLVVLAVIVGYKLIDNQGVIERQEQEIANKELMLDQIEGVLKNNLEQQEIEREARDAADRSYQRSLKEKQAKITQLNQAIEEAGKNDKEFQQCMSRDLPDSVYDSLFKSAKDSD